MNIKLIWPILAISLIVLSLIFMTYKHFDKPYTPIQTKSLNESITYYYYNLSNPDQIFMKELGDLNFKEVTNGD